MSKWKERMTIAPFSLAVSLSLWGILVLLLATLAMALYSSSSGTVPERGGFNNEFEGFGGLGDFEGFQFPE